MDIDHEALVALLDDAADAILEVYAQDFDVDTKGDDSPVTAADMASHQVLTAGLPAIADIPIVSEEGRNRTADGPFWLVDPLDGTKEFIHRNGEFTVNVALMEGDHPVLGCVQVPVTGVAYLGGTMRPSRRRDGTWSSIMVRPPSDPIQAVVSKSHRGEAVDAFLANLEAAGHAFRDLAFGSSLKICKVAEGTAHIYPRLGPTMPWDTAAAHAVLEGAGGHMLDAAGHPLRYPDPGQLNPWFLAASPGLDWASFVPQRM